MRAEALHVDAVEAAEITRIVEPDVDLGDIGQGAAAQRQGLAIVEAGASPLADDIRTGWNNWIGMNTP